MFLENLFRDCCTGGKYSLLRIQLLSVQAERISLLRLKGLPAQVEKIHWHVIPSGLLVFTAPKEA